MRSTELNSIRAKLAVANKKIIDLEKRLQIAYKDVSTNLDDFIDAEQKNKELQNELVILKTKCQAQEYAISKHKENISRLNDDVLDFKTITNNLEKKKAKMLTLVIADPDADDLAAPVIAFIEVTNTKMMRAIKAKCEQLCHSSGIALCFVYDYERTEWHKYTKKHWTIGDSSFMDEELSEAF